MSPGLVAAIIYEPGAAVDERLSQIVAECRARGMVITGLVQRNEGECAMPGFAMALEDIATGQRIALTDAALAEAQGCMLDISGLAHAASTLAVERHLESDCVVINKFGRQEMLGRGLRQEMAALVCEGLAVLTTVRRDFVASFEAFAGEGWVALEPEADAVMIWLTRIAQQAHAHPEMAK